MEHLAPTSDPFWLIVEAFLAERASPIAMVLAIDLVSRVYWPARRAFRFEPRNPLLCLRAVTEGPANYGPSLGRVAMKSGGSSLYFQTANGRPAPSSLA